MGMSILYFENSTFGVMSWMGWSGRIGSVYCLWSASRVESSRKFGGSGYVGS